MKIQSFKEWARDPSYHGSYDDYVQHMKLIELERTRESEERIAQLVVEKLRKKS